MRTNGLGPPDHCPHCGHGPLIHEMGCPLHDDGEGRPEMVSGEMERRSWTEEAVKAVNLRPEATPAPPTTETAAWRAGYVAGYVDRCAREFADRTKGRTVPSER